MPEYGFYGWSTRQGQAFSLPTDYISGLVLTYATGSTITIGTGSAWNPINGQLVTLSSPLTLTPALAASALHYVYLDATGNAVVSTTAPVYNYQGTAWQDAAKGASGRRYVGAFLTDGSSQIYIFKRTGNLVRYIAGVSGGVFRVLNALSSTVASVSCSSVVPATSVLAQVEINNSTPGFIWFGTSDFPPAAATASPAVMFGNSATSSTSWGSLPLNSSQAFQYVNASISSGVTVVDVQGYYEDR